MMRYVSSEHNHQSASQADTVTSVGATRAGEVVSSESLCENRPILDDGPILVTDNLFGSDSSSSTRKRMKTENGEVLDIDDSRHMNTSTTIITSDTANTSNTVGSLVSLKSDFHAFDQSAIVAQNSFRQVDIQVKTIENINDGPLAVLPTPSPNGVSRRHHHLHHHYTHQILSSAEQQRESSSHDDCVAGARTHQQQHHHQPKSSTGRPRHATSSSSSGIETSQYGGRGGLVVKGLTNGEDRTIDSYGDAYCEFCCKKFCNKYYLRKHKVDVHGVESPHKSHQEGHIEQTVSNNNNNTAINTAMNDMESENGQVGDYIDEHAMQQYRRSDEASCIYCGKRFVTTFFLLNHIKDNHSVNALLAALSEYYRIPLGHDSLKVLDDLVAQTKYHRNQVMWPDNCRREVTGVRSRGNADHPVLSLSAPQLTANTSIRSSERRATVAPGGGRGRNAVSRYHHHSLSSVEVKLADRVKCDICHKELCNKYFLKTHKFRVHGISRQEQDYRFHRKATLQQQHQSRHRIKDDYYAEIIKQQQQQQPIVDHMTESCMVSAIHGAGGTDGDVCVTSASFLPLVGDPSDDQLGTSEGEDLVIASASSRSPGEIKVSGEIKQNRGMKDMSSPMTVRIVSEPPLSSSCGMINIAADNPADKSRTNHSPPDRNFNCDNGYSATSCIAEQLHSTSCGRWSGLAANEAAALSRKRGLPCEDECVVASPPHTSERQTLPESSTEDTSKKTMILQSFIINSEDPYFKDNFSPCLIKLPVRDACQYMTSLTVCLTPIRKYETGQD